MRATDRFAEMELCSQLQAQNRLAFFLFNARYRSSDLANQKHRHSLRGLSEHKKPLYV
jgi:hypothetical protein